MCSRYGHLRSMRSRNARCNAPSADLPRTHFPSTCFLNYNSQKRNALPSCCRHLSRPLLQYSLSSYHHFGAYLLGSLRSGRRWRGSSLRLLPYLFTTRHGPCRHFAYSYLR